jgi:GT2 family glycosyltransferase
MGAYLMIRRGIFEAISGFDERFFLYFEDVELCLRPRQAEWRGVHFAGAQALHYGGHCTGAVKDMRLFQYLCSRILFVGKYYRSFETICVLLATIFLEIPLRLIRALIVGIRMEVVSVVRGS